MSIRPLIYYPNPLLKQISEKVNIIDSEIKNLVNDMIETMYHNNGAGLAAVQIGVLKRIMILDVGKKDDPDKSDLNIFINPEIIQFSEEQIIYPEGCLSFPGGYLDISRPKIVKVKYIDLQENEKILEADGWLARGVQHELDHLNGKTLNEYVSKLKSELFLRKIQKYRKTAGTK